MNRDEWKLVLQLFPKSTDALNRETIAAIKMHGEVIRAFVNGTQIEFRSKEEHTWTLIDSRPTTNLSFKSDWIYRIKPQKVTTVFTMELTSSEAIEVCNLLKGYNYSWKTL